MGIYIKNMEMPKKCIRCPVNVYGRCLVNDDKDVSKATADAVRDKDCPLVPVPDHGRLIDANKLKDTLDYYIREAGWGDEINKALGWVKDEFIDSEPTIIPAEPPKEET